MIEYALVSKGPRFWLERYVVIQRFLCFRVGTPMSSQGPNPALYSDAPGPSRPLHLSHKGRAGLRRAGKRERYASKE